MTQDYLDERRSTIASRLHNARKMAGLSQGQVARILGIHKPYIAELELGKREITADELGKLAEIYDVSESWLLDMNIEQLDSQKNKVQLATRELKKIQPEDLEYLLVILASMRKESKES